MPPRSQRLIFSLVVVLQLLTRAVSADTPTTRDTEPPTSQPPATTLTGGWPPRKLLADLGITFDATLTLDSSKNLRGGLDTAGLATRHLFETTLAIDTEPLLHLPGGKLFLDFQNQAGDNASLEIDGDAQRFDNIDADGRTQLAQVWYQQTFLDERVRLKLGKVDANSEFQKSDYAGEFLQSSAAYSPTIFVIPTYPDPATSINLFVQPGGGFYVGFGTYDGSLARGVKTGSVGPTTFFHDPNDLFFIAEIGRRWGAEPGERPGRLALGGWYGTNRFARLDGHGHESGTGGPYFLLEQMLYRPAGADKDDPRGIAAFTNGGEADPAVSLIDLHLGGGVAWTGPSPDRRRDVAGLGVNAVHFSRDARLRSDHEIAVETFYRVQITPWAAVKPDLQYIVTPGGTHRDALVATVRLMVSF